MSHCFGQIWLKTVILIFDITNFATTITQLINPVFSHFHLFLSATYLITFVLLTNWHLRIVVSPLIITITGPPDGKKKYSRDIALFPPSMPTKKGKTLNNHLGVTIIEDISSGSIIT